MRLSPNNGNNIKPNYVNMKSPLKYLPSATKSLTQLSALIYIFVSGTMHFRSVTCVMPLRDPGENKSVFEISPIDGSQSIGSSIGVISSVRDATADK